MFADWLQENNTEPHVEVALRWMAKNNKHPHKIDNKKYPYMWTCYGGLTEGLPHAALPRCLCKKLDFHEWRCYYSFYEAIGVLGVSLMKLGDVVCEPNPFDIDSETKQDFEKIALELQELMNEE